MWSAQAVREFNIDHTKRHLPVAPNSAVGWHWNTHIKILSLMIIPEFGNALPQFDGIMHQPAMRHS